MNRLPVKDDGFLSEDDVANGLMLAVRDCTEVTASKLKSLEKYFCLLDHNGDSVLKHAIDTDNLPALEIISKSKYFDTIKNILNKDGDYAVLSAALIGNANILRFLLSNPRNCRFMPPVCKKGTAYSILHEVIIRENIEILNILLDDLSNKEKYSKDEVKYILSFHGNVKGFGYIDPYNLAVRLGKIDVATTLSNFSSSFV